MYKKINCPNYWDFRGVITNWSSTQIENLIDLDVQLNVILRQYLPYKFILKIQPSLLDSINSNFEEDLQVSCVSKKDKRKEVENKLSNEYKLVLFILKRIVTFQ